MSPTESADQAVKFVNLLVPGHFSAARSWILPQCTYQYQGKVLRGAEIINAFEESHHNAVKMLDHIEYLRASAKEQTADGILVAVSDQISLNGQVHTYHDRLLVKLENIESQWRVISIEHRPIEEERAKLKLFLAQNNSAALAHS